MEHVTDSKTYLNMFSTTCCHRPVAAERFLYVGEPHCKSSVMQWGFRQRMAFTMQMILFIGQKAATILVESHTDSMKRKS